MESQHMLEAVQAKGLALAEAWSRKPARDMRGYEGGKTRYINFLEGLDEEDDTKKAVIAQLLENTYNWIQGLDESTRTLQVGAFEKFVFPILRALLANLVASDLVTVHPLDAPTGLVFYFDVLYGSSKGKITKGSKMFDARTGPASNYHYSDEIVEEEPVGTGNGSAVKFTPTLSYNPIRAGTVKITDGAQVVQDDGNGILVGNVASIGSGVVNTVDYQNGDIDFDFASAPGVDDAITATYEYNSEANMGVPEIDLQLTSAPVTARPNKLRARWSIEAQQDFQAYHGINAEVELVTFMANEIAKEINYKIISHLQQVANAGSVIWEKTPGSGVPYIWHRETLYDSFVEASNLIFTKTQRVGANWVVAGVSVCNVIEVLSKFNSTATGTGVAGVRKIGSLGDFQIFKDPTMEPNSFLVGFKGQSFLDTGYIYAPYLQLYTTGTVVLDDMIARKGMVARTGLKVVNSGMYATGTVIETPAY